jgi:hypothetical protein
VLFDPWIRDGKKSESGMNITDQDLDLDPHLFGSLDTDPHWGTNLDPDPH